MRPLLVIGATGTIGREVASQLLARKVRVRAMVRNPQQAGLPPQVELVKGDLTVPETINPCLPGIDSVFLVWTAPPSAVAPAMEQIVTRSRRIVFLSSPHKTPHSLFQQPNPVRGIHSQIEQLIEGSGVEWTFLRPGMFAANAYRWWAPQIRTGNVVRWPFAAVPTAPIHERDVAAFAVRSLLAGEHANAEYVLTGPQSLTHADQVRAIGDAIGRPLRFIEISPNEAREEMLAVMPLPAIDMLLDAWAAAMGQPALITSTFSEITGTPARTFHEWATNHAADFSTPT